jgi:hypothetical protein
MFADTSKLIEYLNYIFFTVGYLLYVSLSAAILRRGYIIQFITKFDSDYRRKVISMRRNPNFLIKNWFQIQY